VSQRRGSRVHELWARFRFSLIGHLLAAREWRHPVTGEPIRFGVSTLERWYYRARRERYDPVGVLRRRCATTPASRRQ